MRLQQIFIFIVLGVILAYVMYWISAPTAVLTKDENDIDNTIIGDSATDNHSDGPAYMAANWHWPMPLAFWNPVATERQ